MLNITQYFEDSKRFLIIILFLVLIGFSIRIIGGLESVLFTFDQARDAFISQAILQGDFKIKGPPSDIPGLSHGPLFYYIIAPLYFLGGGDPRIVLIEMIIINLLTIIPLGLLAYRLFNNKLITYLAILLYVVSFEAVSYARWISNPSLAIPALGTYYLGLWLTIKRINIGWIFIALGLGVSMQAEVFLVYLIPVTLLALFLFRIKLPPFKTSIQFLVILFVFMGSFLVSEIKFGFQGLNGLKNYFLDQNYSNDSMLTFINNYKTRFAELFQINLTPLFPNITPLLIFIILGIVIFSIFKDRKNSVQLLFLLYILFSNVIMFTVSANVDFINVGVALPVIILTSFCINKIFIANRFAAIAFIIFIFASNLIFALKNNFRGNILLGVQETMRFKDEIDLVKETYDLAGGGPFSVTIVSNPLFVQTTWSYAYNFYSSENDLKMPSYIGIKAETYPGEVSFSDPRKGYGVDFIIIEPQPGIPDYWIDKVLIEEEMNGRIKDRRQFGTFSLLIKEN